MLHESVGAEGKALLPATGSIEFNQVAGNVLDTRLRTFLQSVPCSGSQSGKSGNRLAVATLIFRNLIERMDAYVHLVVVGINDTYHLLILLRVGRMLGIDDRHSDESCKLTDTQIHMYDVVARFHLLQFLHRQRHLTVARRIGAEVILMETVENLMVGEEAQFQGIIGKTLMQRMVHGNKLYSGFSIRENILQTLLLLLTVRQNIQFIVFQQIFLQGRNQQFKVLMEQGLGRNLTVHGGLSLSFHPCTEPHLSEALYIRLHL